MEERGLRLFGRELARRLGDSSPQTLLIDSDIGSTIAITRIRSEHGSPRWTERIIPEKGFTIPVHLKKPDVSRWATSIDGLVHKIHSWPVGGIAIYDLQTDLRVIRDGAFEVVHFNVPRSTLERFTDDAGQRPVTTLKSVEGVRDDVIHHLAQLILPSIEHQQALPALFLDCFVQGICSRIVSSYAEHSIAAAPHRGGLAPWQKRRTLELLDQHLSGDLRLARLATENGLSSSYFSRCFRKSFGVSVHQFVIQKRVERARDLLLQSRSSLAEIAMESGFSDQAAFSRTFAVVMGVPPARWKAEHIAKRRVTQHSLTHRLSAQASNGYSVVPVTQSRF